MIGMHSDQHSESKVTVASRVAAVGLQVAIGDVGGTLAEIGRVGHRPVREAGRRSPSTGPNIFPPAAAHGLRD